MSTALTEVRPARGAGVGAVLPAALRNLGRRPPAPDAGLGSLPFPGDPTTNGRWPVLDVRELERRLEKRKREPGGADPRVLHALLAQAAAAHDNRLATVFEQEHQAYAARLYRGDAVGDLREARDRGLDAIRAATEDRRDEVVRARDEARRREDDLEEFRTVEGLRREPHYPPNRLKHVLTTVLVGLGEVGLNALLLGSGLAGGRIEGAGLAAGIAVANIGSAFLAGLLGRYGNHRSAWKKSFGIAVAFGALLYAFFFNLLVAHYREAIGVSSSVAEAGRAAWTSFRGDYLGIGDFDSWVIAIIGMACALFAAWKGYSMEDDYPGYSRRSRVRNETQDLFDDVRREALDALEETRADNAENIQSAVETHRAGLVGDQQVRLAYEAVAEEHLRERRNLERAIEPLRLTHCPDLDPIVLDSRTARPPLPETAPSDAAVVRQESETARRELSDAVRQSADSFESGERS